MMENFSLKLHINSYKNNYNHQEIPVRENTFIHFAKVLK